MSLWSRNGGGGGDSATSYPHLWRQRITMANRNMERKWKCPLQSSENDQELKAVDWEPPPSGFPPISPHHQGCVIWELKATSPPLVISAPTHHLPPLSSQSPLSALMQRLVGTPSISNRLSKHHEHVSMAANDRHKGHLADSSLCKASSSGLWCCKRSLPLKSSIWHLPDSAHVCARLCKPQRQVLSASTNWLPPLQPQQDCAQ